MFFGRKKILTDVSEISVYNIEKVLNEAMLTHNENRNAIESLYNVYIGKQKILSREKTIRPEINNKIVENRANEIVSFKVGYLCGEPIQYINKSENEKLGEEISKLNDYMSLCGKITLDTELAQWMYIAGIGYRYIAPNSESIRRGVIPKLLGKSVYSDDPPFKIHTLDPRNTFVVRYSDVGEPAVMAVRYVQRRDGKVVYSAYTKGKYFELESGISGAPASLVKVQENTLGRLPIIEYPLNSARLGAFEIVLPILDAINTIQSNRVDGIEQFIQSLIVLYNADIDEEKAAILREAGLIKLKSHGDNKADIKILSEQLDQMQTQQLVDYMYQTVLNIVGMPNRNGGNSTSDTGAAVIVRDGWSAAEARAKSDEQMFKFSEIEFIRVVLNIMRDTVGTPLKLMDIDIKFTRRNYDNIQSKSQVLISMLGSPWIHPLVAYEQCGMFSDPQGAYMMGKQYHDEVMAAMEPVTVEDKDNENDIQQTGSTAESDEKTDS